MTARLLDQTCRAAVARQIAYGRQRSLPWGISESGYNTVDANLNYQYHAFGVPGLGLTRGLAEDLVIAPYASALALLVAPEEACANLQRLAALGMEGPFGFYEAVDYTPARLPRGQSSAIVRSFMAHHQGMNLRRAVACAPRPADAEALRVRSFVSGDPDAAAGANPEDVGSPHARGPARRRAASSPIRPTRRPMPRYRRRHADARSAAAVERPAPRHGHQCGWRLQPLEGSRDHPLARGHHLRQLGFVHLSARRRQRRILVGHAPADAQAGRQLRGHVHRGARRVPPPRPRLRNLHRDRRIAGGRHRAAQAAHHQPCGHAPDDRGHELRRGGAGPAGRGRVAAVVRQPVRADGNRPGPAHDTVHAAAAIGHRADAVDVPPDRAARRSWSARRRTRPTGPVSWGAVARSRRPSR